MRFHYTTAFAEAKAAQEAANENYCSFDDEGPGAIEREKEAGERLNKADNIFWTCDAFTPFEIGAKIDAAKERTRGAFPIDDLYPVEAMKADIDRLKRMAVSPAFAGLFTNWRIIEVTYEDQTRNSESEYDFDVLSKTREGIYEEIMAFDCITPAEFIVKQYISALGRLGGQNSPQQIEAMTPNMFDLAIDVAADAEDGRFDAVDENALYRDLDNCEIGKNLLAYGKLEFDAELWMEAADRVGLDVLLMQQPDGRWTLWTDMADADEPMPRIRRERDRLRRLMVWPDENRCRLISDEIRSEWPQLVVGNSTGAAQVFLDDLGYSPDMEADDVLRLADDLTDTELRKFEESLEIVAASFEGEARSLRQEIAKRIKGKADA